MVRLAIAAIFLGFCASMSAAAPATIGCPERTASSATSWLKLAGCNTCCRRVNLQYQCGCC